MRNEYDFSGGKRGAVIPSPGQTRVTLMLDDDLIEHFRSRAEAEGTGYQQVINAILSEAMARSPGSAAEDEPLTASTLRRILREELNAS